MKYLILAGGSGTRLWPLSRKNTPKQFINLTSEQSMLQETIARVTKEDGADVSIIAGSEARFIIRSQMSEFKNFTEQQIIEEPCARNTAPAIAYASLCFEPNDIVAVLSSDHHITDAIQFNETLKQAEEIAKENYIVTLGIIPDAPRTGYGYIKQSSTPIKNGFKVDRFVEKPNLETAKAYLAEGGYFWNAGIFVFKVSTLHNELKEHAPQLYKTLMNINSFRKERTITMADFEEFEKISIDYALMEKSKHICVVPSNFGWSDVGSFKSLYELLPHDEANNALKIPAENRIITIDCKNTFCIGAQRKIVLIGLNNTTIVDTDDALLIADSDQTERVKEAVEELQLTDEDITINQKTIHRPWGSYTILDEGPNYKVKQLYIRPQQSISLQYHYHRSENWTVASGIAQITKGDEVITLKPSETIFIPATVKHRLTNPSKVRVLKIIEVQTGEYLGEDDIIRIDDLYKRE